MISYTKYKMQKKKQKNPKIPLRQSSSKTIAKPNGNLSNGRVEVEYWLANGRLLTTNEWRPFISIKQFVFKTHIDHQSQQKQHTTFPFIS
jgi:hypothetical protein